jgi:hypothetical protein
VEHRARHIDHGRQVGGILLLSEAHTVRDRERLWELLDREVGVGVAEVPRQVKDQHHRLGAVSPRAGAPPSLENPQTFSFLSQETSPESSVVSPKAPKREETADSPPASSLLAGEEFAKFWTAPYARPGYYKKFDYDKAWAEAEREVKRAREQ